MTLIVSPFFTNTNRQKRVYYTRKEIMIMVKKFFAEFVATAILVLLGCGTAMAMTFMNQSQDALGNIVTAPFDGGQIVAIAAAFGMSIIILAYTVGPISGGHANPAVSFAKALNKEITWKEFGIYVGAQVAGAFFGSLLLAMVMWAWGTGVSGANGLYSGVLATVNLEGKDFMVVMLSTMAEMGMTFLFIFAVLGLTSKKEWAGFAGIGIGLVLFGVHLVGIPLTGTSVNPARALSALIFSMFNGQDLGVKGLALIPAIIGPFLGSFAAWSAWHGFYGKKKEAEAEAKAE